MKTIAKSLGLSEDATEDQITAAITANLTKITELEKVENKVPKNDDDDDDDKTKNVSNDDDDTYNTANAMKNMKNMEDRISNLEKMVDKFKKSAMEDAVSNKITALVASGKVENKAEVIADAKAALEKDFDFASKVYDSLPAKKVDLKSPGAINNIIAKAAKEHGTNQSTVSDNVEEKTLDMYGKEIDLSKIKKPSVKDALAELNAPKTDDLAAKIAALIK